MQDLFPEPRRWRAQRLLWGRLIAVFLIATIAKTYPVHKSKLHQFYKVKQSRRGQIRKARENKERLVFKQERVGIVRHLWIQDPTGPRRQFLLEASAAEVGTSIVTKSTSLKESFVRPKGCLQEELFWEVSSTGERVVKRGDRWVKASSPHQPVSERLVGQIVPVQRTRFFDAETAEWNPETNELIATTAFFSVVKMPGHDLPTAPAEGYIIAQGTARTISFLFDKKGRQQVSCQGIKLHLHQGGPQ